MNDIATVRKSRGLSQLKLGRLADVDQGNLSRWESGTAPIPKAQALKLGEVLDTDSAELIAANRYIALGRAVKERDVLGAMKAMESILKIIAQTQPLTEGEINSLEDLAGEVAKFAELTMSAKVATDSEETYAEGFRAEGRNPHTGAKVVNKGAATSPLVPSMD